MDFTFTPHALEVMQERSIPLQVALVVLEHPENVVAVQNGRSAYQSEVEINGKQYMLRLIVEPDGTVVTMYRTSRISKYGSDT